MTGTNAAQPSAAVPEALQRAIAGALFDFLGFLTTRDEAVTFSAFHEASPAVEALEKWAQTRDLSLDEADVEGWNQAVQSQKSAGTATQTD